MNKNLKVLGIGVLLIGLAVAGWFLVVGQLQKDADKKQNNNAESQKVEMKSGVEVIKNKEEERIGENKTEENKGEAEEAVKENEVIKPKFGINDSGLKYNKDGSIDTSGWKMSGSLIEFKYPESWVRLDGVYNTPKPDYPASPGQISITMVGFGAPFDIDINNKENKTIDELLINAVNHAVRGTEKYIKEYNGTCQKNKVDKFNVYLKCKYEKDGVLNRYFERTFIHYDRQSGEKTGGSAGLNIEFGDINTLKSNKKIVNQILESAYIGQIIGDGTLIVKDFYIK